MRSAFLSATRVYVDAVGEDMAYHGGGRPAQDFLVEIRGVVQDEFALVEAGNARLSSRRPEVLVALEDLPRDPETDDELVVRGETFRVATVQPDGQGGAFLVLKRI